jgi:hypothetical protein
MQENSIFSKDMPNKPAFGAEAVGGNGFCSQEEGLGVRVAADCGVQRAQID